MKPESSPAPSGTGGRRVMPALVLAMLAYTIVQTAVVPVLPLLAQEFHRPSSTVTWLMTANLLSAAVFTPLLGRIGDLRGRRPVLLVSLGGLVAGSLLAVTTHSFALLIVARVLQGLAGGVLPLAIAVVRDELPADRVTGGMALISATLGVGSGLGLVAAGVLTEHWSYQSIFWFGLAIGLLAMALVLLLVPAKPAGDVTGGADPLGVLTLAGWLVALLVAVSQGNSWGWTSTRTLALFALAAVLLLAWVLVENRAQHPLVDMRMMAKPAVAFTNLSGALIGFGMYGTFMVVSNFVQTPERITHYGFGATILHAGILVLPAAAGSLAGAPVGSWLITRYGPRPPLVAGGLLAAAGLYYLAFEHGHESDVYLACAIFGTGLGLAFSAMPAYINSAVEPDQSGIANGMNAVLRTVGGAIGTSVLGAVLTGDTIPGLPAPLELPTLDAYRHAWLIGATVCLLAAAVPFAIRRGAPDATPAAATRQGDPTPDPDQARAGTPGSGS
ncbi:MFS transporter [Kitasatospora sp. NPDC101176]|uniref:MFS transporter n=1 Tax=Kitasatospora sp. NPDC101176 TaxID=3364099 RepID=UPI0038051B85